MRARIDSGRRLAGSVRVPGDKSISHRALFLAALCDAPCRIEGLGPGADIRSTVYCLTALGAKLQADGQAPSVSGPLHAPAAVLDAGNSGTTARLLAGVLAGTGLGGTIDGDASLRRRPMRRVLEPLRAMGARIDGDALPFTIRPGSRLEGRSHLLEVPSAQVKSALLLAGLFAHGRTCVREPLPSRDHTERMLPAFGVVLDGCCLDGPVVPRPPPALSVPGDISSAAFLLAAGLLVPGSDLLVEGVGLNPTRTGLLRVLERMGADLAMEPEPGGYEPVGRLRARASELVAAEVAPEEIPSLVDEVPVLAVLATQARGRTVIRGAAELRLKESDRLATMAASLRALGARVEELPDGLVIEGPTPLTGRVLEAAGDHRVALSLSVAGLVAAGRTEIEGAQWANISFPGFFSLLEKLGAAARLGP